MTLVDGRGIALASHDDTTIEHVEQARAEGMAISEFPTTLAAAHAAREQGMNTIIGAPNVVLGGSHSGNVSAADLAAASLLDGLSSDYVPMSLLHAALILADRLERPLPMTMAMVSRNNAAMIGMRDRGEIAPGKRADLLRVRRPLDMPQVLAVWRQGRRIQ